MALTKKQRAQVVELLRCAADAILSGESRPECARTTASEFLGYTVFDDTVCHLARLAERSCHDRNELESDFSTDRYVLLLEAAQRVEDCEWP